MRNQDSIRERAYEIWEKNGRPEGKHEEHWDQASRELEARSFLRRALTIFDILMSKLQPWIQIVAMPVVLFFLAFIFKDSLDLALKERQLDFSNIGSLRQSIQRLYVEAPVKDEIEAEALTIGMYGTIAVVPLLQAYDMGGAGRRAAVERGMQAAAAREPDTVCALLRRIVNIAGPQPIYSDDTIVFARSLATRVRCQK